LPDNFFSIPFADLIRSKKINFPQKKSERFFVGLSNVTFDALAANLTISGRG
jgi:hypothetical protein